MSEYLKKHKEVCDIIFSGGDPLMAQGNLLYALKRFTELPHIKIIRIDTRLPVSDPKRIKNSLIKKLAFFNKKYQFILEFILNIQMNCATKQSE